MQHLRLCLGTTAITAAAVGWLTGLVAPTSTASPGAPVGGRVCNYTLTPPQVSVLPGDAHSVIATFGPATCTEGARPISSAVCLATGQDNGVCVDGIGWSTVRAVLPAPQPSGTFIATAKACYQDVALPGLVCIAPKSMSSTF
jgi:hypothetical protein